jgi:hypothetical protein
LVDTLVGFAQNSFKNSRRLLVAFQKSFATIREKYEPIGRKRLKFKTE